MLNVIAVLEAILPEMLDVIRVVRKGGTPEEAKAAFDVSFAKNPFKARDDHDLKYAYGIANECLKYASTHILVGTEEEAKFLVNGLRANANWAQIKELRARSSKLFAECEEVDALKAQFHDAVDGARGEKVKVALVACDPTDLMRILRHEREHDAISDELQKLLLPDLEGLMPFLDDEAVPKGPHVHHQHENRE